MRTQKKIKYITPVVGVMVIGLEQGIAAGSATLSGGAPPDTYAPDVATWGAELSGGTVSGDL